MNFPSSSITDARVFAASISIFEKNGGAVVTPDSNARRPFKTISTAAAALALAGLARRTALPAATSTIQSSSLTSPAIFLVTPSIKMKRCSTIFSNLLGVSFGASTFSSTESLMRPPIQQ